MKKEKNEFEQKLRVWMEVWNLLSANGYEIRACLDDDGEPAFDLVKLS